MKLNNKAQNITNPYTIVLVLAIISMITGVFFMFGQDLAADPSSNINDESRSYIYNNSGFKIENKTASDSTDIYYSSETGSEGNLKDYALEFQFYREKSSSWRSTFQFIYNLPKFFLKMLNIPITTAWEYVILVINTIIWALIFYLIYRIIRGLIK